MEKKCWRVEWTRPEDQGVDSNFATLGWHMNLSLFSSAREALEFVAHIEEIPGVSWEISRKHNNEVNVLAGSMNQPTIKP